MAGIPLGGGVGGLDIGFAGGAELLGGGDPFFGLVIGFPRLGAFFDPLGFFLFSGCPMLRAGWYAFLPFRPLLFGLLFS